jgi:DNA-binding MarR family transcriptional regulator
MAQNPQDEALTAFMRLIWSMDHELRSTSKWMEKRLGLTGPQRLVLFLLSRTPKMTAGQLAAELHIHPSTLTGILARLLRKKLLAIASDPQDARRTIVILSNGGRGILRNRRGTVEESIRKTLAKFSPSEIAAASKVLRALSVELAEASARLKDTK